MSSGVLEKTVATGATINFGETIESIVKSVTFSGTPAANVYVSTTTDALAKRAAADDGVTKIVATGVNSTDYMTTLVKTSKSQKITLSDNVTIDYANVNSGRNALGPRRTVGGKTNFPTPHTSLLDDDKLVKSGKKLNVTVNTQALAQYARADTYVDKITATAVTEAYLLDLLDAAMDKSREVNATLSGNS